MEMVAEPAVLFLDEPTSGLDSSTSREVCRILKRIAKRQQVTVAAVIHSPSLSSFLIFDKVLLLGKGGLLVYFGPVKEVESYFQAIGFNCPADESLPDFLMEVISGRMACRYDPDFQAADLQFCGLLH